MASYEKATFGPESADKDRERRRQLSAGSTGADVKTLQTMLNQHGYNLAVDGIFGQKTTAAVRDFQKKKKIAVDGIVGKDTWGMLPIVNPKPNKPEITTSSTSSSQSSSQGSPYKDYTESETVREAFNLLNQQLANKPGEYQSAWQDQINAILEQIMNREDFSYDLNGDALYQQYKDKFTQQGKMAMMDTMGQAQAMTGGYGNSYAQSVGQQAYQAQLQNLNDIVPELYQMALDKYNMEGQEMYNQFGLLTAQDERDYGRYMDDYNAWYAELDRLQNQYNNEREFDYGQYIDERNYDYQVGRDAVEDKRWQAEFDEAKRQYDDQMAFQREQWDAQNSGGGTGGGVYYNDGLKDSQIIAMQKALGVTADGKWGAESQAAAKKAWGVSSASGAYKKFSSGGTGGPGGQEEAFGPASVSDSIRNRAAGYTDNTDLEKYLDGLAASGVITEGQADSLYAEYRQPDKAALKDRTWTLADDGGMNLWGIDKNAKVTDQYNNTYRLDKLVDALVAEGMSKKEAKEFVKTLQKKLGA